MARASLRLIEALRETAARLGNRETVYRWSQLAHCNCGHLAQTITGLSPRAIQEAAARQRGDWAEQARMVAPPQRVSEPDYGSRPAIDEGAWEPEDLGRCPVAELEMTQIFAELGAWGLDPSDIAALERLDDPEVRRRLGTNKVDFLQSERKNVIAYLLAWADLLVERLAPALAGAHYRAAAAEGGETRELGFDGFVGFGRPNPSNERGLGWPDPIEELPIAAE